ncbi:MAG TPA: hemolysin family protein [Paenibacillus sp.]|uniref:hemolysin family protein n=1 Tax=Paenibacillus sp. TaxID=58172 RepID=UPI0028D2B1F6|nr:hemolysin family protein [Paenibacillus sp.]HUC91231.1 hemolysin family protein [Paenibacillus sp.]
MALQLFMIVLLILFTAFFVATEFAVIRIRPSRVDQLVLEGRKNAVALQKVTANLDGYLSACQLGITITSLGLGWLGEPTVEALLEPVFERLDMPEQVTGPVAFLIAFTSVTYLHVVIGELAPKSAAIRKAEPIALLCAVPIIWFNRIMYPFIWLLNSSANRLVRLLGMRPAKEHEEAHSEDEIRIILSESYESGKINKTELGYVNRIFTFDDLLAREIMVPRTDMICLYTDKSLADNLKIIKREQYTRFPVASGSKDNIAGIINTKKFFLKYDNNPEFDFASLLMPALTVPDVMPVKSLLRKMQAEQVHMALLLDEYGGTSGLITIEDILEEIVGEIRDEFDKDEKKPIDMVEPGRYMVEGKVLLSELNEILGTHLPNDGVHTIGGWLYSENPDVKIGDTVEHEDLVFAVKEMEKHRIRKVEIMKEP